MSYCPKCGMEVNGQDRCPLCGARRKHPTKPAPPGELAELRARLAAAEKRLQDADALLGEWQAGNRSGIIRRDLTERTEAYLAGASQPGG